MTLEKEIRNLKSAYKGNKDAIDCINTVTRLFISTFESAVEEAKKAKAKEAKREAAKAAKPSLQVDSFRACIDTILSKYPATVRAALKPFIKETTDALIKGTAATLVDVALKVPEAPDAQSMHSLVAAWTDDQVSRIDPAIIEANKTLPAHLNVINSLLSYSVTQFAADNALEFVKDPAKLRKP